MTVRIAMWSGPRNISTAMMRSFSSRADTVVSDEPFYGAYLKESGDPQPMAEGVIAEMNCDWHSVARSCLGPVPGGKAVWYQKQMAHHMVGPIGIDTLQGLTHAFLIRDPRRVAASYAEKRDLIRPEHLGINRQRDDFQREADRLGHAPPVVDSADVLRDPQGTLKALTTALGIGWDPAMLRWPAGRHHRDGIWGSHWYDRVEASTGFDAAEQGALPALSPDLQAVADACMTAYEELSAFALRIA
jgi:hypothetical protein